jgi:hypothetical protein
MRSIFNADKINLNISWIEFYKLIFGSSLFSVEWVYGMDNFGG